MVLAEDDGHVEIAAGVVRHHVQGKAHINAFFAGDAGSVMLKRAGEYIDPLAPPAGTPFHPGVVAVFGDVDVGNAQIEMDAVELPAVFVAQKLSQGQGIVIADILAKGFLGGISHITSVDKDDCPLDVRLQHLSPELR